MAAWTGMPEVRLGRSFVLVENSTSLELHRLSSSVFGDGGNADTPNAFAAAHMGACHLPDRIIVEGHFRSEVW